MLNRIRTIPKRFLKEIGITLGALVVIAVAVSFISPYEATKHYSLASSGINASETVFSARITSLSESATSVHFTDGPRRGTSAILPSIHESDQKTLSVGDTVLVNYNPVEDGFLFYGQYRIPLLIMLVACFIALVLLIGRKKGSMSIAGLGVSVLVVGWVIVPLIVGGFNALLACVGGACLIAIASIGIAHGFNRRTFIAIASVLLILIGVTILSHLVVGALNLTGIADETSFYLQSGFPDLDLVGILTGGIIIATLGALDDVVTTQVAVVDELRKANPKLTSQQLFTRAFSVGSKHIAALVNTLALVYAGAALPLLVTYATQSSSLLTFFNSEFIATEITRTIIVSIGLVLSVPLSTWVAARYINTPTRRRRLQKAPL